MTEQQTSLVPGQSFKVAWLPRISRDRYDPNDAALGEILASCDSLYSQLDRIRGKMGMQQIIPYPKNPSYQLLLNLVAETQADGLSTRGWAEWLAYRYKLSYNWWVSLQVLLLTHTLPIPPDPPIGFYKPTEPGGYRGSILNLIKPKPPEHLLDQPLIHINYKVSISQLKKFIEDNREAIRAVLDKLPPKPSPGKMESDRFLIGHIAWILKIREGYKTWGDVTTYINDELDFDKVYDELDIRRMAQTFARQQKSVDV